MPVSKGKKAISFEIDTELWERIRVAAFQERLSRSEWCRRAIIAQLGDPGNNPQ